MNIKVNIFKINFDTDTLVLKITSKKKKSYLNFETLNVNDKLIIEFVVLYVRNKV